MIFGITYFNFFILIILATMVFVFLKIMFYNPRKHARNNLLKVAKSLKKIKPSQKEIADFPDIPRQAVKTTLNAVQLIAPKLKSNAPEKFEDLCKHTSDLVAAWALTYTEYRSYDFQQFKIYAGCHGLNMIILTEALLLRDAFSARRSIKGVDDPKLKQVIEDLIQGL